MDNTSDVLVVGAGPAGCAMALLLADSGLSVRLLDRVIPKPDQRTTALDASSVKLLEKLALWEAPGKALRAQAQPILSMQVLGKPVSAAFSPFGVLELDAPIARRAPETQHQPLGYMIPNRQLHGVLLEAVDAAPRIVTNFASVVTDFQPGGAQARLICEGGKSWLAPLIVAADGINSPLRALAGINCRTTDYGQMALTAVVTHSRSHGGVAFQRFDSGGPLALLPLPDSASGEHRSSLVWSDRAELVAAWLKADQLDGLARRLEQRAGFAVGGWSFAEPPRAFPLSASLAQRFYGPRLALIAEAAHHIHPLAGQGMNLGLRDAVHLSDLIRACRSVGGDIGGQGLLTDYDLPRRAEAERLFAITDGLNRLFQAPAPVQHLARLGMTLFQETPLHRLVAREMTRS